LTIVTLFTGVDEAAAASKGGVLNDSQTSATTKRITVKNGKLGITINNLRSKDVKYTIFKNGKAHLSDIVKGNKGTVRTINVPNGQYSLRVYCGVYTRTTGCASTFAIMNK
jgi:hypothetical protein